MLEVLLVVMWDPYLHFSSRQRKKKQDKNWVCPTVRQSVFRVVGNDRCCSKLLDLSLNLLKAGSFIYFYL